MDGAVNKEVIQLFANAMKSQRWWALNVTDHQPENEFFLFHPLNLVEQENGDKALAIDFENCHFYTGRPPTGLIAGVIHRDGTDDLHEWCTFNDDIIDFLEIQELTVTRSIE